MLCHVCRKESASVVGPRPSVNTSAGVADCVRSRRGNVGKPRPSVGIVVKKRIDERIVTQNVLEGREKKGGM